ncbi:MAG: hypothetical protein H0V39_07745 [Nitrosomonas sp.]|nr:hypothetical protein [Nitrosomonas sp.]
MKAVICFNKPDNKLTILSEFQEIIQGVGRIRQHVLTHGILFEPLRKNDIEVLKNALIKLNYAEYTTTDQSLRLNIVNGDFRSLFRLVIPDPLVPNDFASMFWEKGFSIDNLPSDQANDLQDQLEAIAAVTVVPDTIEPSKSSIYTVSGQVRRHDDAPFIGNGYMVRAYVAVASENLLPLGNPSGIDSNGGYIIRYLWQSDGRNGPDLVVQLFDPENKVVTQQRKPDAGIKETANLEVKQLGPKIFTLTGIVKNQVTGTPLSHSQIETQFCVDNNPLLTRSDNTNTQGVFNIAFDAALFDKLTANQKVAVIFTVVNKEDQPLITDTTIESLQPGNHKVDVLVSIPESNEESFIVEGTISKMDGSPLPGVVVRAFDRDLRKKELLGEKVTNVEGFFEICYTRAQFSRMEKTQADIYLELYTPDKKSVISPVTFECEGDEALKTLLINSGQDQEIEHQIWFNAPSIATINGMVKDQRYRILSEYERYVQELTPLMGALPFEELVDNDIVYLAAKTEINALHISYLRTAAILKNDTKVAAQGYYGMFRQNLPSDLFYLLTLDVGEWQFAIWRSIDENIIPPFSKSELEAIITQLQALLPKFIADLIKNISTPAFTNVLKMALPDTNLQQLFVSEYEKYHGSNLQAFWEKLKLHPNFKDGIVENIQFIFQAAALTRNNPYLVQILQQERQQGHVKSIDDLADWPEQKWINLFQSSGISRSKLVPDEVPGETAAEKEKNYILFIVRLIKVFLSDQFNSSNKEKYVVKQG